MTTRDLDRLISKTELTPISKQSLRVVRKAVVSGRCGDPEIRTGGTWSVKIDSPDGHATKMTFSFKRDSDADRK